MRFVTSCITGRSPQTFAGATLLRAFSVVHSDGPTWASRSQPQSGVQLSQKPNSAIFVLVTNLSSQVIEEDSPHRPPVLGETSYSSAFDTSPVFYQRETPSLPAAAGPRPSHEPHTSLRSHPHAGAEPVPHLKHPTLQHPRATDRQR